MVSRPGSSGRVQISMRGGVVGCCASRQQAAADSGLLCMRGESSWWVASHRQLSGSELTEEKTAAGAVSCVLTGSGPGEEKGSWETSSSRDARAPSSFGAAGGLQLLLMCHLTKRAGGQIQ